MLSPGAVFLSMIFSCNTFYVSPTPFFPLTIPHNLLVSSTFRQWYTFALPVVASVGSVLVGSMAAVIISSKTEPLSAWLKSLNDPPPSERKGLPATNSPKQSESLVRSNPGVVGFGEGLEAINLQGNSIAAGGDGAPSTEPFNGPGGDTGAVGKGDRILLGMVLVFSLLFAYLSSLVGSSDLLGCFLGGMAFSGVPGVQRVWGRQVIIRVVTI